MNVRCNLGFLKHLIQDTFRQAVASGIFGMMLVVTAICVMFCLSVDVSGDVALHSDSEPAFFLPPPPDHSTVASAGASQNVRLPFRNRSCPGATRQCRDDQRPHDPGVWCRFHSCEPRAERCCPFSAVDPCQRHRRHLRTAADPGVNRGVRPDVPGPKCGVGPARQAHSPLATASRQVLRCFGFRRVSV